jgi:proteasome accessory factor B
VAKLDRLLNLVAALLDTTVPLTAEELRERVPGYPQGADAFHRSFERDKDDLRELGIPVETVVVEHHEQPRSAYTIQRSRYELRDPGFELDELAAIHLAATTIQLEGLDPDDVEEGLRKLGGLGAPPEGAAAPVGALPVPDSLLDLFVAVLERRQVGFRYSGAQRTVQPHRLQFERGRWYVTGHDPDRGDRRSFRLDRIDGPVISGEAGTFARPDEVRGVRLRPWELGEGPATTATVLFDPGVAKSVLVEHPDLRVVERRDDGSVVVELDVRNRVALRGFLMTMLDRAELLGPDDLRDEVVSWLTGFVDDTGDHTRAGAADRGAHR